MSGLELLPITKEIYAQMQGIAWLLIGPFFLLSCVLCYIREPLNFPAFEMLHRIAITIALLMFFPEITSLISKVGNSLAERVGERGALDALFAKVQSQANPEEQTARFPFLLSSDIYVSFLNYISYSVVYLARYLMIALYHFFWSLMMAVAPIVILCNLFRGTSHITKHLFSSMIEISSWQLIWQIMAVMLLGLNVIHPDGRNYFDAICFNFLLALGMIATPILVHTFVRSGMTSTAGLSAGAVLGVALGPAGAAAGAARKVIQHTQTVQSRVRRHFTRRPTGG